MSKNKPSSITRLPKTIWQFVFEARDELKKVSWPDRQTTVRYTIIVVAASLIVGAFAGGIDYVFTLLLERVI